MECASDQLSSLQAKAGEYGEEVLDERLARAKCCLVHVFEKESGGAKAIDDSSFWIFLPYINKRVSPFIPSR